MCNFEKHINNSNEKYSECKDCSIKRGLKRYYETKVNISIHRKIYNAKNRDKLLQKQNGNKNKKNTEFKELHRSYIKLQIKSKTMEEKLSIRKYNHSYIQKEILI